MDSLSPVSSPFLKRDVLAAICPAWGLGAEPATKAAKTAAARATGATGAAGTDEQALVPVMAKQGEDG